MRLILVLLIIFLIACNNVTNDKRVVTDTITKAIGMKNNCDCSTHDTSFQSLLRCFDKSNCKIPFSFLKFFPLDTIVIIGALEILDTSASELVLKTGSKHLFKNIIALQLSAKTSGGAYFAVITYDVKHVPIHMFFDSENVGDAQSRLEVISEANLVFCNDSTFEYKENVQTALRIDHDLPFLPREESNINMVSVYKISNVGKIIKIDSLSKYSKKDTSSDLSELDKLNKEELRIVRNAIYAKYNYRFKSPQMNQYFKEHISGYEPISDNVDNDLTTLDIKTLNYISDLEKK